MFDAMHLDDNSTFTDTENMFQLALMDAMTHAGEYGLDEKLTYQISMLLTYTGSGQHNNWIDTLPVPPATEHETYTGGCALDSFQKIATYVIDALLVKMKDGSISATSITYHAIDVVNGRTGTTNGLDKGLKWDNYKNGQGQGWITSNLTTLSPLIRTVALSALLEKNNSMSLEDINIVMTGSKADVDKITQQLLNKNAIDVVLSRPGGWQNMSSRRSNATPTAPVPMETKGLKQYFGFNNGLTDTVIFSLFSDFPQRQLTDAEIKSVNTLGDNAKMLYELLKFQLEKMNETRQAVAGNI